MPPVTADKLKELLDCGAPLEDIDFMDARYSPWYLRSNYGHSEILFHVDGSVKGGTVAALVTRLTSHEYAGKQSMNINVNSSSFRCKQTPHSIAHFW
jgi:hypothetical protein